MKVRALPYVCIILLMLVIGCSKKGTSITQTPPPKTPPVDTVPGASSFATAYGTYNITCANGGNFLEVSGDNMQGTKLLDGTGIDLTQSYINPAGGAYRWVKWIISKQSNGYFTIMNLNSGKYIDVPNSTTTAGTTLDQYRGNSEDRQYWSITTAGIGSYKIINKANGLAITDHGASTANGAIITQETYTGATSQQWELNTEQADSYRDDAVVGFFQRTTGSDAFDGGASVPLTYGANNGKVFWQTNDTFYSQVVNGEFSCGLILSI